MRYRDSIFGQLLKPISRRWFEAAVERHGASAYDKSFESWDHLVALTFAQLSGVQSLRGLVTAWATNVHHHYHLGVESFGRSTLSDANARRPIALFAETFAMLAGLADRISRREGTAMLRLIDATPIPLGKLVDWAKWNGRIRGLKLHVVYDPDADVPHRITITPANVNDIEEGKKVPIETDCTYVMDKAYCDYRWWTAISDAGAFFVTRQKTSAKFRSTRKRRVRKTRGDGFTIIDDHEVKLTSKGDSKLAIPLRRIRVKRDTGGRLTLLTNDLERSAVEIAALYKARWQIELLFRWIKQHLNIRKFLGNGDNAIRLQIVAAMIAYLLLRIAARESRMKISDIRFAELVAANLFVRKPLARIDKPPEVNPSRPRPSTGPGQMELRYA
jgi:IS4 transposase